MSHKKKRIAKGLGASALAVATIASGLSFGVSAASAASPRVERTGALYAQEGQNWYSGGPYLRQFSSEAAAREGGERFSFEALANGRFFIHTAANRCLRPASYGGIRVLGDGGPATCGESDVWTFVDGRMTAADGSYVVGTSQIGADRWWTLGTSGQGLSMRSDALLSAVVDSVDIPARSALLNGRGTPGADLVLQWGDGEFEDDTRVNNEGIWDFELDNLKLGSNPVKVLQYQNQQLTGEYELDVELKVADLTVAHRFGADVKDLVTLSGTAQGGAIVQVFNADDRLVVAAEPANAITGAWSVKLPAPNKGGSYDLNVYQSLQGERTSKTPVSIDYGKQLVVTRPADGFVHPGGEIDVRGTGEPGATVEVREGDRLVGGPAKVRDTENWNLKTTALDASEHRLTVTQHSKGGNVQTDVVVVNEGQADVEFTAAGRFDATDATKPAIAHGSAPAGSTVILRNSVGTEIGRATAAVDDTYEITIDPSKVTSGVNTFSAIVQGDAGNAKSFTLDYGAPAAPIVVTSPAKNGTVEPGVVRFAGTGQADSKIVVRGSAREVATAAVNAQGAWSANSTMELTKGSYNLYFDQIRKGGLKSTIQHAFTIGESAPIVTPVTVTSPGPNEALETLTPEFRGTGHNGATITVRGSSRVVATGTVQNGQWVANTNAAAPLAPGTYNLYVDQAIRGTVTSTIRISFTVSNEAFRELTLSAPAQNANVTTLRPTFVGTATPGAQIRVGSSRTTVATATVAADGTWRATADFDLARGGTYSLEVKQTLKSGKTSTVATNFTVNRDAQ